MSETADRIRDIKRQWGARLLILGHHYQRRTVLCHADEIGDSLELSRKAAHRPEAERIVFCGVRFMAESACILAGGGQAVYMPVPRAGCPMADMAPLADVAGAWERLGGARGGWVPVVYVNSSAALKAFCGAHGGSTCTSSNAARVFTWALAGGRRIFFVPDEHLGRNTARDLGIGDGDVACCGPAEGGGGPDLGDVARARVAVWKGFCLVHRAFTAAHVQRARAMLPGAKIIVHPETPLEVVAQCDAHGSTSQIIRYVEEAPAGSTVVIGTEVHLIERLAEEHAGRVTVKALSPSVCANMAMTGERDLLEVLETWPETNRIRVPEEVARDARKALRTMLEL